jgi:hypothetical protein
MGALLAILATRRCFRGAEAKPRRFHSEDEELLGVKKKAP